MLQEHKKKQLISSHLSEIYLMKDFLVDWGSGRMRVVYARFSL